MRSISINGELTQQLSALDRGLHYGDGLFETIAVVDDGLQFWDAHLQRLQDGAARLGMQCPPEQQWFDDTRKLLQQRDSSNAVIKLILTRGPGERGYRVPREPTPTRICMLSERPAHAAAQARDGVSLCLCRQRVSLNPDLAGLKHLNRLDNVLARNEWADEYAEGLMLDVDGNVIEGTMSNVFAVRDGTLYTPSLQHCGIDGIIRAQLIDIARQQKIAVKISKLSVEALYSMDEVFVCNSIIGIWPVVQIETSRYRQHTMTRELATELAGRMRDHAKNIT